jgi:hypothetical protein
MMKHPAHLALLLAAALTLATAQAPPPQGFTLEGAVIDSRSARAWA